MNSATGQVKPVVLFGESVTALGAAWCLRKHPITVVSAKFVRRLASHSRFVRRWLRLPDRSPDPLFACLEELREREGELLLFPCSDAWIDVLGRDLQRTRRIGRMLPESPAHLAATLDKLVFGRQVRAQGLPAPEVYSECVSPDWAPPQYPLVLKPYSTYRLEVQYGVKALIIHNREEWQMFAEMFPNQTSFLAQEYLDGPSISVCFCTTVDSRLAGAYVTEKTHYHSMRIGTRVASADRPEAIELTAEFVRRCGFVGFGELEMIEDRELRMLPCFLSLCRFAVRLRSGLDPL